MGVGGVNAACGRPAFFGFLHVNVEAPPDIYFPILPIRPDPTESATVAEVGIIYPIGTMKGVFFSEELKYALSHGYKILEFYEGYHFLDQSIVFDGFVELIYKKRIDSSSDIEAKFWKRMLNSLYGRFALSVTNIISPYNNDRENPTVAEQPSVRFIHEYKRTIVYNVAVAIVSWARIHMHKCIVTNNLISALKYIDTDGIPMFTETSS